MCTEFELLTPDGTQGLQEGKAIFITLKPAGAYFTICYRIVPLKCGGLEIHGDTRRDDGESGCDGVCVQPVDAHTVQVWTT